MPYIYAAFVRATETGSRCSARSSSTTSSSPRRDAEDEYLFGRDLLVAPVTSAGMTARQVYLPVGHWYDWHSSELLEGGRYVIAETPMDRIPVYARAEVVDVAGGAGVDGRLPSDRHRPACLRARHGRSLKSLLVEDDGLTFDALDRARLRTTFLVTRDQGEVAIDTQTSGDGYRSTAVRRSGSSFTRRPARRSSAGRSMPAGSSSAVRRVSPTPE